MKKAPVLLVMTLSLLLAGCLGDVVEFFCETGSDSDHCYQTVAVQEGDPEDCAKITGEGFTGTNPPKDKCHLMIGQNTGDASACEGMEGGFMSYSPDECYDAVFRNHTVEACANAADEVKCRSAWARKDKGCGDGFWFDKANSVCVKGEPPGSDDDIESKAEQDLNTLKDAATGKYMELLTKAIEDEQDDAKKAGLEAYKKFLEESGEKLEEIQTTVDQLKEIKRIFLDSYDPSMDVNRMSVNRILDPGLFGKIQERLFGADEPSERGKAESALEVYEKMLERQGEIDFLKKQKLERLGDVIASKTKEKATDELKSKATAIAQGVAGTAFATVGIVDHALSAFQEGAQKEVFIGLAAAYNRQRDAIAASSPNLTPEQIHERTVASVKENPYADNPNAGFVKYGNVLENKDCQDEGNPLCIDNRVFWTAMDKTYQYNAKQAKKK